MNDWSLVCGASLGSVDLKCLISKKDDSVLLRDTLADYGHLADVIALIQTWNIYVSGQSD